MLQKHYGKFDLIKKKGFSMTTWFFPDHMNTE